MSFQFNDIAHEWWNEDKGSFTLLHQLNPLRIQYILNSVQNFSHKLPPLGLDILDVGCGGGLLCEPLTRLGAHMTGIDESARSIQIAEQHKKNLSIHYVCGRIEEFHSQNTYDVITAFEVIEHVENPEIFIKACIQHLKPRGLFILSTLARNFYSYVMGVAFAEYVIRWVPKGTHSWDKFLNPSEVSTLLVQNQMNIQNIQGYSYNPFIKTWHHTLRPRMNYFLCSQKQ